MIPYATTTVAVYKPSTAQETGEPTYSGRNAQAVEVASGVRAVIGRATGSESGNRSSTTFSLACDLFGKELSHLDGIKDETTGARYEISWAFKRVGLGLDHWTAELNQVEGL